MLRSQQPSQRRYFDIVIRLSAVLFDERYAVN